MDQTTFNALLALCHKLANEALTQQRQELNNLCREANKASTSAAHIAQHRGWKIIQRILAIGLLKFQNRTIERFSIIESQETDHAH